MVLPEDRWAVIGAAGFAEAADWCSLRTDNHVMRPVFGKILDLLSGNYLST